MAAVGGTRVIGAAPIVLDMINLQRVKRKYSCNVKSTFFVIALEKSSSSTYKTYFIKINNMSF